MPEVLTIRGKQYIATEEGERVKLERVPTRKEVVEKLGYDPVRLAQVMRFYWRIE